MSARGAQRLLSADEFLDECAYDVIEPGEPYRSDVRFAMLASVIYNCLKAPKSKALDIDDFIIKFLPRGTAKVKKQSQAVIKQNLLHWAAIHKAKAKASKQKGSKASPRKR